jgi:hypothetical protein
MVKFIRALVIIISTLTASTLAVKRVKSCYCDTDDGNGEESDANTKPCCDQWENQHAPGVKYSGDFDDRCVDPDNVIDQSSWNNCCVNQGSDLGNCYLV